MRNISAFTLIELMVAVAILGILVALAAPSFVNLVRDYQRSSAVNDLLADMAFARSESAQRGRVVIVCAGSGTCGDANAWGTGWLIYEDTNGDGDRDDDEPVLRRASGRQASLAVSGNKAFFRFRPFNQRLLADAGTVSFCDPRDSGRASPKHSRAIVVAQGGRTRVAEDGAALGGCV